MIVRRDQARSASLCDVRERLIESSRAVQGRKIQGNSEMYAVIKTGGKQYRVAADEVLTIEKVAGEAGQTVEFTDVLMVAGGSGSPKIGAPAVAGAKVMAEVVEQGRAAKVIAFKRGHRQHQTTVRIKEIIGG
jgi:large subunit ribosomal protein L21